MIEPLPKFQTQSVMLPVAALVKTTVSGEKPLVMALPAELMAGVVFFTSEDSALDAVDRWRPVPGLRMLEYLDAASI